MKEAHGWLAARTQAQFAGPHSGSCHKIHSVGPLVTTAKEILPVPCFTAKQLETKMGSTWYSFVAVLISLLSVGFILKAA